MSIHALSGCGRGSREEASNVSKSAESTPSVAVVVSTPEKLLLFAAASTGTVLDEIKAEFEKLHDQVVIRTNYGATSTLAQQIEQGAEADLFLAANQKWAEFLTGKGLVEEQRDLLGNALVVIVLKSAAFKPTKLEDLCDPAVTRLAVADPEAVPAGIYAKQALTKQNLWERLQSRLAAGDDVRQTLTFVETGAAEAGIVYRTDAALSDKVEVALTIDPELTEPIRYPLVLLKHGAERKPVRLLYDYLLSPAAAEIFQKHGFVVLETTRGE